MDVFSIALIRSGGEGSGRQRGIQHHHRGAQPGYQHHLALRLASQRANRAEGFCQRRHRGPAKRRE